MHMILVLHSFVQNVQGSFECSTASGIVIRTSRAIRIAPVAAHALSVTQRHKFRLGSSERSPPLYSKHSSVVRIRTWVTKNFTHSNVTAPGANRVERLWEVQMQSKGPPFPHVLRGKFADPEDDCHVYQKLRTTMVPAAMC